MRETGILVLLFFGMETRGFELLDEVFNLLAVSAVIENDGAALINGEVIHHIVERRHPKVLGFAAEDLSHFVSEAFPVVPGYIVVQGEVVGSHGLQPPFVLVAHISL